MLTTKQAADMLGVAAITVRKYVQKGYFPNAKRYGYAWLIPEEDVKAFVKPKAGKPRKIKEN